MMSHMHLITLPRADPKKKRGGHTDERERRRLQNPQVESLRIKRIPKSGRTGFFSRIEDMQNR